MSRPLVLVAFAIASGAVLAHPAPGVALPGDDAQQATPAISALDDAAQAGQPSDDPSSILLESVEAIPFPDIRDIAQDDQGFMWFAANHPTESGLLRYDGYELKQYQHDPDDETSLSNNQVAVTYVDNDNVLWVGTIRGGLNRYNADDDNFTRYLHSPSDEATIPSDSIKAVLQTSDGAVWVATDNGLARRDNANDGWEVFQNNPGDADSLPDNDLTSIVEDPTTGDLWVGTGAGLARLNPTTGTFTNYTSGDDERTLSDDQVEALHFDTEEVLWIGTKGGLNRYDRPDDTTAGRNDSFTRFASNPDDPTLLTSPVIRALLEDTQGRFWVGHGDGVQLFDRQTGTATNIADATTRTAVLGDGPVTRLYEDDAGAVWFGSNAAGAARVSPFPRTLTYFRNDPADQSTISSDFVARVTPTNDGLWIITDAGIDFFNGTEFRNYNEKFGVDSGWPDLQGILEAHDGTVWVGTNGGTVFRVDPTTGDREDFDMPEPASAAGVWPIAEAENGNIWLRLTNGLGIGVVHPDGEVESLIGSSLDEDGPERAYFYHTYSLFDEENQAVWVTGLGLTRFDANTTEAEVFTYNKDNPEDVVNQLWSVEQDDNGTLWLASSDGVFEFDPDEGEYVELHRDELPIPGTTDVRFGPDNRLWLVSGSTLTGWDIDAGDTITYDASDETITDTHLDMESWVVSKFVIGPDRLMYAPTIGNGLVAFNPERIATNPHAPEVVLTGADLFGAPLPIGEDRVSALPVNRSTQFDFGPNEDTFTFEFAALDFEQPERNQYRYLLEGFDEEWHTTDAERRVATYTNVPPGDYTFRVQGSNNSGVWSTNDRVVGISVARVWYATWWFRALVAVLGIGLVALLLSARSRRRRLVQRERERRLDEQAQAQKERAVLLDAVEEQADRIEAILAAAPVGVVLLGPDGEVLLKNRVADEEFDAIADVDPNGHLITVGDTPIAELIGADQTGSWRTATFGSGDEEQHLSITVRPIEGGPDERQGWVLLWDDVTELQALQQRTARQQRLAEIGRFAAGIAHDVNNVLTVIGLNAELLNLEATMDTVSRKRLTNISNQTGKATRFIGQILDYARPKIENPETFNLHVLVATMVERFKDTIAPQIQIEYHGESGLFIEGDPFQIERIVMNLLTNAVDAVNGTGKIIVRVEHLSELTALPPQRELVGSCSTDIHSDANTSGEQPSDSPVPTSSNQAGTSRHLPTGRASAGWARLSVSDDGEGIEDGILDTIFEPFFTTKQVGRGTGLGLSQVASIASEHMGIVSVATATGLGSTFVVDVPAVELGAVPDTALEAAVVSRPVRKGVGEAVLVVDDEAEVRIALGEILTQYGFAITQASDGTEALKILDQNRSFDLIISDIMMPDLGGGELLNELAQRSIATPVVLMSGVVDRFNALSSHPLVSAAIPKPIDIEQLLDKIGTALPSLDT